MPAPMAALRGRPAIWRAVRALAAAGPFSLDAVLRRAKSHPASTGEYLRGLTAAGYLAAEGKGDGRRWTLVRDAGREAPHVDRTGRTTAAATGRDQLWRAMKMRGEFSALDLTVGTAPPVAESTAAEYCRLLAKAGYLAVVEVGRPGHKPGAGRKARYRLLPSRITGPAAPQIMRTKMVWDPNTEQVMGLEIAKGDEP